VARGTNEVTFEGHAAIRVEAGGLVAHVATGFGPRVVGLEAGDSGNLLAALPDVWLPTGDGRRFRFRGGHRLWEAPEVPAETYRPDDEPVDVTVVGDAVQVAGPADPATGLRRSLALAPGDGALVVRHVLTNEGETVMRRAPWALTQLPVGGRAWLSLRAGAGRPGPDAVLPDRALVLWPYTDLGDPHLHVTGGTVEVDASWPPDRPGRVKVGSPGGHGRLAYLRDGWLFEKAFDPQPDAAHADFGAAAQVYADERFIELETLGPLVELAPGGRVEHVERWRVERTDESAVRRRFGDG
jgi:hypothetical protein